MTRATLSQADITQTHGSNAERSRAFNRSLVLGHVRASGASGRAEIARACGLSTQAVSKIIAELVSDGWLQEAGRRSEGRGLPAVQYTIDPSAGIALGIELRPAAVLITLIGLDGRTVFTRRVVVKRADPETLESLLPKLKDEALTHCTPTAAGRILGAGVVMPGPFGMTGLSGAASDLPGWADLDPADCFSRWLDLPVTIENDANAGAMTERVLGVAQDITSFAYVYFGTGLGLGLLSGDGIQRGARGNAGEIGHMLVPYAGGMFPLEQAVSRMALRKRIEATGRRADVIEDLEALMVERHPALFAWLDEAAIALSHAIHIVENLFDPDTVIFGGALPESLLDALLARISLSDSSVANRPERAHPRLLRGACGRMTATRGAAALVINQALTPRMTSRLSPPMAAVR